MFEGIEVKGEVPDSILNEIKNKVEQLRNVGVSDDDIRKFIVKYLEKRGYEAKIIAKSVKVSSIGKEVEVKKMVTVQGKVLTLFEPKSNKILQTGLIGDDTGIIKFVFWNGSSLKCVKPGQTYVFKNVIVNEFADAYQVESTSETEVTPCEDDVQFENREITGVVLAITGGLNMRCPECYRIIEDKCPLHGDSKPIYTLDIKLLLSTTDDDIWVTLSEDAFKELTGFDVDSAIEKAKKSMDRSAIVKEVEKYLLGRVLTVAGINVEWGQYKGFRADSASIPELKSLIIEKLKTEVV